LFNLPFSAIFFVTFYKSHCGINYLFQTPLPYKESLHSSRMRVYKFVELNSFGSSRDVLPNDLRYVKLIIRFVKCDETFCNKVKLRSLNKKRWIILFIYYGIVMYGWFTRIMMSVRWKHAKVLQFWTYLQY
jgi:hypothetical protein